MNLHTIMVSLESVRVPILYRHPTYSIPMSLDWMYCILWLDDKGIVLNEPRPPQRIGDWTRIEGAVL
jgi:hypothetical protein